MTRKHQNPHIPKSGDLVGGRFEIGRIIGEGGFSVVFEANQTNLQRRVALKMLLPDVLGDSYNLKLFRREAQFAKKLHHPYIIELFDYGETNTGLPFIVMEFLEGEALGEIMNDGPVRPRRLWKLSAQVLKALMAAHRQGVVHRDIKPSNIFVSDYSGMADFVKVIDFGIAKAFTGPGETSTHTKGKLTGTPNYMAPEQISGEGLGPHTDIYALGLVMAEALIGRRIFGEDLGMVDILRAQMSKEPLPIPEEVFAGPLGDVIARAVAKPIRERYRFATQMLEDIEKITFDSVKITTKRFVDYKPPQRIESTEPKVGTLLNERWRLEQLLSVRPFTWVYRATQLSLERQVVIKMLRPEATQQPHLVDHFQNEMRIVRQLDNPHTIRILDYGETDDGLPYMVMEWLKGIQLNRILLNVRLLSGQVVSLARQILYSLREAHQRGVFHRDIRPASIFLCRVGMGVDFAKLTDFGRPVSQMEYRTGLIKLPETNQIIGAPHYMAPEQLLQGHIGPHTDIYSLGLVLVEALTGSSVYDSKAAAIDVARQQVSDAPAPIAAEALQGHLGAVLERATRKELALRYTSANEMLEDLELVETQESASVVPVSAPPSTLILNKEHRPIEKPGLRWVFETRGYVRSMPVVAEDGTVYASSFDGSLYAIYPSGKERWSFQTNGELRAAPAIDAHGNLYLGSRDARIYAVSPSGEQLWAYETVGPVNASPVLCPSGTIYIGSGDRYLYALSPDGVPKWFVATRGPISSKPALGLDGTVYVGSEDECVYAIDPEGKVKWTVKTGGRIYGSPCTGENGDIYVGSEDEHIYALSPEGKIRWSVRMEFFVSSTPVIGPRGNVFICGNDGTLYAIDPSGDVLWTFSAPDSVTAAASLDVHGNIYFGCNDGQVYSVDPSGALRWTFELGEWIQSSPVIAGDGTVFVGVDDKRVYAIEEVG